MQFLSQMQNLLFPKCLIGFKAILTRPYPLFYCCFIINIVCWCSHYVLWLSLQHLLLAVPWIGLHSVIGAFPDHTYLLLTRYKIEIV